MFNKDNEMNNQICTFLDGRKETWLLTRNDNPVRYLGFWIDSNLNTTAFFTKIISKIQFGIFIMSRIQNFYPEFIKIQIFNCFIQSHLEFCAMFYFQATAKIRRKIFSLQKKGLQFVRSTGCKLHHKELFTLYDVPPVEILSKLRIFQFMNDLITKNKLKLYSQDWTLKKHLYNNTELRNGHHLSIPFVFSTKMKNMPYAKFPQIYNEIIDIFNSENIKKRMFHLREHLIESYSDFKLCKEKRCKICSKLSHDIKLSKELKEEKKHRIEELVIQKGLLKKERYKKLLSKYRKTVTNINDQ